ncbi:MAG: HEAT repeat domain-containing protein [Planctomycetes bacterium]|nr:HEAT repeat domain-containing protein [Planctomycetota bacterium]
MRTAILLLAVLPFARPTPTPLAIKPHPSPFRMANEAKVVVEGKAAADGTVVVTRRWFVAPDETVGATLLVPSLPNASKVPFAFGQKSDAIVPDVVLLFLVRAKGGEWEPLLRIDGDNARGIVWIEGEKVWDYSQAVNPGPYELSRAHHMDGAAYVATTPADVRRQVEAGLAARGKWVATLALADAEARARAVVGWIGAQSPDGAFWYERVWGDLAPAIKAEGRRAMPFLAKVVATHAEADAVAVACRALSDLGPDARDAVPSMIARLRDLRGAAPIDMVRALSVIRDERAIAVLLDQLDAKDGWMVEEVAVALQHCGAKGFVDRIVRRIPQTADEAESVGWLVAMLDAVREVDAPLAERLVRERFLGEAKVCTERHWMRQLTK